MSQNKFLCICYMHTYSKPTVRGICIMKNVLELKEVQKAVEILHHPWLQHY